MYQIQQKDFTFEDKHYRLFIAVPAKNIAKLTALYTLDGNAQFPMAVNAVIPINLSRLLSVSVMYQIKLTSLKNARETTLSRQKVPNSPKEEKPPIFYILFNKT